MSFKFYSLLSFHSASRLSYQSHAILNIYIKIRSSKTPLNKSLLKGIKFIDSFLTPPSLLPFLPPLSYLLSAYFALGLVLGAGDSHSEQTQSGGRLEGPLDSS